MRNLSIIILSSLWGLVSCGGGYVKPVEASQTGVSLSFFNHVNAVSGADENVVTSPYSAAVCLSMLAEGAGGETRAEFDSALGGIMFKAEDLGSNDTVVVKSANSIWIDDNFSIRNSYVNLLQKDFDAFITTQRFSDPATVKAINNWCLEHTEGKIGDTSVDSEVITSIQKWLSHIKSEVVLFKRTDVGQYLDENGIVISDPRQNLDKLVEKDSLLKADIELLIEKNKMYWGGDLDF